MNFTITREIQEQRVRDLLCCGMESGSYNDFVIVGYEDQAIADKCEFPHFEAPLEGTAILMKDKYGDSDTVYALDRAAIQRGLQVLGEMYPHHLRDFLAGNEDVITGTSLIQCALLGEIIYA